MTNNESDNRKLNEAYARSVTDLTVRPGVIIPPRDPPVPYGEAVMQQDQSVKGRFLKQLRVTQSIGFPHVARAAGLDFAEVHKLMRTDPAFVDSINLVLQEIKYDLLDKLLEVARSGKSQYGSKPDAAAIKAVIAAIDSGVLTGSVGDAGPSEDGDGDLMKRLGIDGGENE